MGRFSKGWAGRFLGFPTCGVNPATRLGSLSLGHTIGIMLELKKRGLVRSSSKKRQFEKGHGYDKMMPNRDGRYNSPIA
jgi:hypothetical protein